MTGTHFAKLQEEHNSVFGESLELEADVELVSVVECVDLSRVRRCVAGAVEAESSRRHEVHEAIPVAAKHYGDNIRS